MLSKNKGNTRNKLGVWFPLNHSVQALHLTVSPPKNYINTSNRNFLRFSDAELDNLVGQEPVNSPDSNLPTNPAATDTEFTPIPLNSEDTKIPTNQPARQSYFTSILSSFPNLSLSSITGDSSVSQGNQGSENAGGVQNTNPHVPSHDRRDSLKDTTTPVVPNFHDPRRTNFLGSGDVHPGSGGNLSAPPQSTLPPTVPSSTDGKFFYFYR